MSTDHADFQTAAITSMVIGLCPDPDCQPSEYKLCAGCTAVLDEAYPERCPDPDCYPCRRTP